MVGGSVTTASFREVVDDLLRAGEVVEVREVAGGRLEPRHLLVLTSRWDDYAWGDLLDVRGRDDVVARLAC